MRLVDKRELPLNRGSVMHGPFLPSENRRWDLGSSDLEWRTIYARSIVAQSVTAGSGAGMEVHELASTSALGSYHSVSGLTAGQVLRASGSTTAAFAQLSHSDLGSVTSDQHHAQQHTITGSDHTASGLTTGHVIRASGSTTFAFAQLQHTDLGSVTADQHHAGFIGLEDNSATAVTPAADDRIQLTTGNNILSITAGTNTIGFTVNQGNISHDSIADVSANDHHNQSHVIATTSGLGTDHTTSGLTAGYVLRASGATTAAFAQLQHTDLGSVSANQHHNQQHTLSGSDHTGDLAFSQLDSLTAAPTIALGTSGVIGSASTIIRSDATIAAFNDGANPEDIDLSSANTGDDAYAARRDHVHALDLTISPTWSGTHTFQSDIQLAANLDFTGARSITTDSTNNLTIAPGGDIVFDPTGNDLLPNTNYDLNIGSLSKKYLTLHAAELWVETLVAQDTLATIGGRILVGPTTILASDISNSSSSNSLLNPGFESAGAGGADDAANWTENALAERNSTDKYSGSWSMRCTYTVSSASATQDISVTGDEVRLLRFWTRGNGSVAGRYAVYDVTNSAWIISGLSTGITSTSWAEFSDTYTVPSTCTTVRISLYSPPSSGSAYFDDVEDKTIYPISVEHNQMSVGDIAYMENSGNVEFVLVHDGPSGAGPYTYYVERDYDESGSNSWYAGTAVFNTGTTDDGFIDLYSASGVYSGTGPTIVGNVRSGTAYNAFSEYWAIGNLNGLYGFGADTYGVGLGAYGIGNYLTIDETNGIRFRDSSANLLAQLTGTTWTLGNTSTENLYVSSSALQLRYGTTVYTELTGGALTLGNASAADGYYATLGTSNLRFYERDTSASVLRMDLDDTSLKFYHTDGTTKLAEIGSSITLYDTGGADRFVATTSGVTVGDASEGRYITIDTNGIEMWSNSAKIIDIDASTSDVILGKVETNSANIWWDADGGGSTGQLKFRGGTNGASVQAYVDTDGSIVAGGGNVKINTSGISLLAGSTSYPPTESSNLSFVKSGTQYGSVGAYTLGGKFTLVSFATDTSNDNSVQLRGVSANNYASSIYLSAEAGTTIPVNASIEIIADDDTNARTVEVVAASTTFTYCDLYVPNGGISVGTTTDPGDNHIVYTGYLYPRRGSSNYAGRVLTDVQHQAASTSPTLTTSYQTVNSKAVTVPAGAYVVAFAHFSSVCTSFSTMQNINCYVYSSPALSGGSGAQYGDPTIGYAYDQGKVMLVFSGYYSTGGTVTIYQQQKKSNSSNTTTGHTETELTILIFT